MRKLIIGGLAALTCAAVVLGTTIEVPFSMAAGTTSDTVTNVYNTGGSWELSALYGTYSSNTLADVVSVTEDSSASSTDAVLDTASVSSNATGVRVDFDITTDWTYGEVLTVSRTSASTNLTLNGWIVVTEK